VGIVHAVFEISLAEGSRRKQVGLLEENAIADPSERPGIWQPIERWMEMASVRAVHHREEAIKGVRSRNRRKAGAAG